MSCMQTSYLWSKVLNIIGQVPLRFLLCSFHTTELASVSPPIHASAHARARAHTHGSDQVYYMYKVITFRLVLSCAFL